MKKSLEEKLRSKKVWELKAIYIRVTGKDLLRGKKEEMIYILKRLLESEKTWSKIIGN